MANTSNFFQWDATTDGFDHWVCLDSVIVNGNGSVTFEDGNENELFTLTCDGNTSTTYYLMGMAIYNLKVKAIDAGVTVDVVVK